MNAHGEEFADRYSRQSELFSVDLLRKYPVTVIGVGAIGRQAALQLAVMGASPLILIDGDLVKSANLAIQGYREDDLGKPKVQATAELIDQLNAQVEVVTHFRRFHRSGDIGEVVFCGVDSTETRGHIFRAIQERVRFFIDTRMNGESLRILTVCNQRSSLYYPRTLFRSHEAFRGPCQAPTTYYAANIAAGVMVGHYSRWLRGLEPPIDIVMKLLADELVVNTPFHQPKIDVRVRAQMRQVVRC